MGEILASGNLFDAAVSLLCTVCNGDIVRCENYPAIESESVRTYIYSIYHLVAVVNSCCITRSHVFLLFRHFITGSVSEFNLIYLFTSHPPLWIHRKCELRSVERPLLG